MSAPNSQKHDELSSQRYYEDFLGQRDRADKAEAELAALRSDRDAIIEECAQRCDSYSKTGREMAAQTKDVGRASSYSLQGLAAESCAEAIRALKKAAPQPFKGCASCYSPAMCGSANKCQQFGALQDAVAPAVAAPVCVERATDPFSRVCDLIEDIKADRYGKPLIAALHLCNDLADELAQVPAGCVVVPLEQLKKWHGWAYQRGLELRQADPAHDKYWAGDSLADEMEAAISAAPSAVPAAASAVPDADCLTCHGDPAMCASVPGLRHCEKANREEQVPAVGATAGREAEWRAWAKWANEQYRAATGKDLPMAQAAS